MVVIDLAFLTFQAFGPVLFFFAADSSAICSQARSLLNSHFTKPETNVFSVAFSEAVHACRVVVVPVVG